MGQHYDWDGVQLLEVRHFLFFFQRQNCIQLLKKRYDLNKIDHLGATYDTCSVMHYGPTSFAKVKLSIAFLDAEENDNLSPLCNVDIFVGAIC